MNKFAIALLSLSTLFATGTAMANAGSTVNKGTVSYQCQSGKHVKVTYGFNKQGLPTFAKFTAEGRSHYLPIDLSRSDVAGTNFESKDGYSLGASYLDFDNYLGSDILITNPNNQIIYKNCTAVNNR